MVFHIEIITLPHSHHYWYIAFLLFNINLYIRVFVRLAFSHSNHRYFIDHHFISYMFMTLSLSYDIRVTFQVTLTSYHTFDSLYYHLHVVVFIGKFQGRYSFHSLLSLPVLLNILGLNLFS